MSKTLGEIHRFRRLKFLKTCIEDAFASTVVVSCWEVVPLSSISWDVWTERRSVTIRWIDPLSLASAYNLSTATCFFRLGPFQHLYKVLLSL